MTARNVSVAVLGALTLALVLAAVVLLSRQTEIAPIMIIAPTPAPQISRPAAPQIVRVHLAGAVANPGVYAMGPDDRLVDAIAEAGGETHDAELSGLNLAERVRDEARYYVPRSGEDTPPGVSAALTAVEQTPEPGGLIDLNTASVDALETLPGIGPALAGAIVAYRESDGPFQSVDELLNVPRIGPATLEKLRPLVTVSASR